MLQGMLILALLLAAQPVPDVTILSEPAQVKELCEALSAQPYSKDLDPAQEAAKHEEQQQKRRDAASRYYQVEVPSKGFALGRYRARDRLLELDGDRPLSAMEGALHLDLEGIDDVAFDATAQQVADWSAEKKANTLRLVVVFKPSGDRCAGSAAAQAWRISGKPRNWQILGDSGVVAQADADGEPVGGGPRALVIDKVSLDTDNDATLVDEGRARFNGIKPQLDKCMQGAQHSGNLVVTFDVRSGKVADPQVIVDSLRDERIAECVSHVVAGVQVGGSGRGTASLSLQ
jgi:hypothetical protein